MGAGLVRAAKRWLFSKGLAEGSYHSKCASKGPRGNCVKSMLSILYEIASSSAFKKISTRGETED